MRPIADRQVPSYALPPDGRFDSDDAASACSRPDKDSRPSESREPRSAILIHQCEDLLPCFDAAHGMVAQ